jgi:uncharacterized protein YacL
LANVEENEAKDIMGEITRPRLSFIYLPLSKIITTNPRSGFRIMIDAVIIILCVVAAASLGFEGIQLLPPDVREQASNLEALRVTTASFGGIIGLAIGIFTQTFYRRLERKVRGTPIEIVLTRAVGLVIGLLIANLVLAPISLIPFPRELAFFKPMMAILGSIMFSFLGVSLADTHGRNFLRLINPNSIETLLVAEGTLAPATTKILDTSCIIDGRIQELLNTGFIEGQILIPIFVLQELQNLADAGNDQKRIRGRRGLDILNKMQEDFPKRIVIHSADYPDYNLSKVANLQKVFILNVNDLAQAIRPIYLPGDLLELKILKQGKEAAQGIGYLDDGTMVVVEEGRNYLGSELRVTVTSALQTSAGRMIFAKPHISAISH